MKVLGIDPGLATTGYAVIQHDPSAGRSPRQMAILEAGVIRTPPHDPVPQRLHAIYADMKPLIQEFGPDALAVEEVFFNRNVTTAITVSEARGVVLLASSQFDLECVGYSPVEIKRQICGYGRATKGQVQAMIKRLLGLDALPKPDDAADALAVALCFLLARQSGLSSLRVRSSGR